MIPVSPSETASIPTIAYSIPDFEGQAIARIFSNTTQSQIACFSAALTNGNSFAHPIWTAVGLGAFTVVAFLASLMAAIYGTDLASTRSHYAHSLSMFVVFSVFHHIYYTGALSMNWPRVLVAFWSNYAWAAGMIYNEKMQNSINQFLGNNRGNISVLGAAAAGTTVQDVGGGFNIAQLYKRAVYNAGPAVQAASWQSMAKRSSASASSSSLPWHGSPVKPGLPLPGNYSGFAGTLSQQGIPASNAFMTGLIWFAILLAGVPLVFVGLKLIVEAMGWTHARKQHKFARFRNHWLRFAVFAMLRTFYIAFFMMTFLSMFQLVFGGSSHVLAVSAVVLGLFIIGVGGLTSYALYYRMKGGRFICESDRLLIRGERVLCCVPWFSIWRESRVQNRQDFTHVLASIPWWRLGYAVDPALESVHDDEAYLLKFGWLYARFRRTKWFAFAIWLFYELALAGFYGAAAGHPLYQVFGILAVEFIALIIIIWMRPFQATRLNALMVYLLGFSKVATVALSSAFDYRFGLDRILTTVIGIAIIIIQGMLTIFLLVAITAGAISTYMSLTRDREIEAFRPRSWRPMRRRYLEHVQKTTLDLRPQPRPPTPVPEEPKEPSFSLVSVVRFPKIEDEDEDSRLHPARTSEDFSIITSTTATVTPSPAAATALGGSSSEETTRKSDSHSLIPAIRRSDTESLNSRLSLTNSNLPFGARPVRASWNSMRDFEQWQHWRNELNLDDGQGPRTSTDELRSSARAISRISRESSSLSIAEVPDGKTSPTPSFSRSMHHYHQGGGGNGSNSNSSSSTRLQGQSQALGKRTSSGSHSRSVSPAGDRFRPKSGMLDDVIEVVAPTGES